MRTFTPLLGAFLVAGCVGVIDGEVEDVPAVDAAPALPDAPPPQTNGPCPADMKPVGSACMDRFEAPNVAGAKPLVMYSFDESEDWCEARGKRRRGGDEWELACGGEAKNDYVYGDVREPGRCNDAKEWIPYVQSKLNGWPADASEPDVESLEELLDLARSKGTSATVAADHVLSLYQGEGSGSFPRCVNGREIQDLTGNVEEWTRRRDGGAPSFHGNLKGRYWADTRTCGNDITTHGDAFRFYEIGFRCCSDL